jgi:hypothetical protein
LAISCEEKLQWPGFDFGAALSVYAAGWKNEGLKAALASSAVQSVDHSRKIEEQRMSRWPCIPENP